MQNKLIIFDIDGTLTNTNHVDALFFEKAILETFPIASINTDWYAYKYSTDSGIVTEIIQSKLNRDPTATEMESIKNKFVSYLESAFLEDKAHCIPINGAQILFKNIFARGYDIGIATGGWKKSALLKLRTAKIPCDSLPIAHSDDHFEREKIISIAINRSEIFYKKPSYEKIIYVGDKIWDKRAAKNLGIDFIGIGGEFSVVDEKDFICISGYSKYQLEQYLI